MRVDLRLGIRETSLGRDHIYLEEAIKRLLLEWITVSGKRLWFSDAFVRILALRGVQDVRLHLEMFVKLSIQEVTH